MSNFRNAVGAAARAARETGALQSIPTSSTVARDESTGLEFLVRLLRGEDRKAAADARANHNSEDDKAGKAKRKDFNPFLPYDESMFVEEASETHVCLLNKFNVVNDHVLLVTKHFEEQSSLLTLDDFTALWRYLGDRFTDALAFYNAGTIAGASQRHKHLQLVPTPIIQASNEPTPLDPLLRAKLSSITDTTVPKTFSLPELGFLHRFADLRACARLPSTARPLTVLTTYHQMLTELGNAHADMGEAESHREASGERQPFAYNLLATREWMMIVPRRCEAYEGISVNSLGFACALLVKDPKHLEVPPLTILRHVAFQC